MPKTLENDQQAETKEREEANRANKMMSRYLARLVLEAKPNRTAKAKVRQRASRRRSNVKRKTEFESPRVENQRRRLR